MSRRTFMVAVGACAALLGGCTSANTDWSKEPVSVTVSSANYSELTDEQLYAAVHAPSQSRAKPPAITQASKPMFYGFVPGEIYESDTPVDTVFRELAVPLAKRGYFNVVYEVQAGLLPSRVDYLLRVHCGVRPWRNPILRTDRVTWGDDGLVSNWRDSRSMWRTGKEASIDSREGQSLTDIIGLATMLQEKAARNLVPGNAYAQPGGLNDYGQTRDYCIVVVEAFRFDDVCKMKKLAPCVWATFVAVPLHPGQQFSGVLRTMTRTATAYFGDTASGLQSFDIPAGNVTLGEPKEVPQTSKPATP